LKASDKISNTVVYEAKKNKMSRLIDLCEGGSENNGERPNAASVPSLPRSSKRLRDKKESSNDAHLRKDNGPGKKTATGSTELVVDLELAEEVEVSPNKKRRGVKVAWEDRLDELADYRVKHGHCNVPQSYRENTKLAQWVANQRKQHRLHLEGKTSPMTTLRSQELESLGFEWRVYVTSWEDRLSELADYRKIHGHCNVPPRYQENFKLGHWVGTQRTQYRWHAEGNKSPITSARIQSLESLGFEWGSHSAAWEDRLSELADYRKEYGNCNVPKRYSDNLKLGKWVAEQRTQYRFHKEGKISSRMLSRIEELESLGFEWRVGVTAWEDRLSELADYRKIHGHCNVSRNDSEHTKLGHWVTNQRYQYRLHKEGKTSPMTLSRINDLESLDFEWVVCRGKGTAKTPSLGEGAIRARETSPNSRKGPLETAPPNEFLRTTGYH
jgi:hypothetical protein